MKKILLVLFTVFSLVLSFKVTSVLFEQYNTIKSLQFELEQQQIKYNIIINDPLVQDVMQAGG